MTRAGMPLSLLDFISLKRHFLLDYCCPREFYRLCSASSNVKMTRS